jgi:hypothetical protein
VGFGARVKVIVGWTFIKLLKLNRKIEKYELQGISGDSGKLRTFIQQ